MPTLIDVDYDECKHLKTFVMNKKNQSQKSKKLIGANIFSTVEIRIGGNLLDTYTGEWLNLWHEICNDKLTTQSQYI